MTDMAPYGVIDYAGYGAVVIFEDGVPRLVAGVSPRIACGIAAELNRAAA